MTRRAGAKKPRSRRTRREQVAAIYNGRKAHAKQSSIDWGVSCDYLIAMMFAQQEKCALSGIPFSSPGFGLSPFSPSLDRLKPNWGYIEGNLRWVLHGINDLKGVGSDEDVIIIAQALLAHRASSDAWGAPAAHEYVLSLMPPRYGSGSLGE